MVVMVSSWVCGLGYTELRDMFHLNYRDDAKWELLENIQFGAYLVTGCTPALLLGIKNTRVILYTILSLVFIFIQAADYSAAYQIPWNIVLVIILLIPFAILDCFRRA